MTTPTTHDPALVAQPRALRSIERLLDEGRAHALLLSGESGSGPEAAARLVARRVLCPGGGDDGCDTCGRIDRRVHPDLLWVVPEGSRLQIDPMLKVVETVSRMPFEGVGQVVVLERAESLSSDNPDAANTLLKSLEEPEGRVVYVLLARATAPVLPTIRSRCIEVAFPPVPDELLVEALRVGGIDEATLAAATGLDVASLARVARGSLERAWAIAAGESAAQRRGDLLTGMHAVATGAMPPSKLADRIIGRAAAAGDAALRAATAEFDELELTMSDRERRSFNSRSNDDGREKRGSRRARKARIAELGACLDELAGWWRDLMAVAAGSEQAVSNVDRLEQLRAVAGGAAASRAVAAIDAIDDAATRLRINNADEPVTVGALTAELAGLAAGRIRARRTLGAPARTTQGYDLSLG